MRFAAEGERRRSLEDKGRQFGGIDGSFGGIGSCRCTPGLRKYLKRDEAYGRTNVCALRSRLLEHGGVATYTASAAPGERAKSGGELAKES